MGLDFEGISGIVPPLAGGRTGIPDWVSDKSKGSEVSIELPKKWYKDDNFLGFALFFHFVHNNNSDDTTRYNPFPYWEFSISQGDQFITVNGVSLDMGHNIYDNQGLTALVVSLFPRIGIPNKYQTRRWNNFKACIKGYHGVQSCGIHMIYDQAQDNHKKRSRHVF